MISEGIAVGVTGAICSAVAAYFKFRKPSSNGNGQAAKKCPVHDVVEEKMRHGDTQFGEIKAELNLHTTQITKIGEGVARIEGALSGMKK